MYSGELIKAHARTVRTHQPVYPLCHAQVQFVVCLAGSWYVETTDGDRKDFKVGEVLYQVGAGRCSGRQLGMPLAVQCRPLLYA